MRAILLGLVTAFLAGSISSAGITVVANTGMKIPVTNGEAFTAFGKEPSQDYNTPGNVAFTATGAIPQAPGSAAVVLTYSQGAIASPPVAETDIATGGITFQAFGPRLSFRHGKVAFGAATNGLALSQATGLYSVNSGTMTTLKTGAYSDHPVQYGIAVNGAIEIIQQTAFTPSFDSNSPNFDLYWASFNSDVEYGNTYNHYPSIKNIQNLYLEKNSTQVTQLASTLGPSFRANGGNLGMYGANSINVFVAGALKPVANNTTPDPSAASQAPGSQTFSSFAPGGDWTPGFQRSYITFWGSNTASGISGIYFEDLGDFSQVKVTNTPLTVAETGTPIPSLTGKNFGYFDGQTCIDGSTIVFVGGIKNAAGSTTPYAAKGIYVSQIVNGLPTTPTKVIDLTTPLDFGDGTTHMPIDLSIGNEALAGGQIVFWAQYDSTHSGIFLTTVAASTPTTVAVQATDANASTAGDPGTFTVSRTVATTSPLTVHYAVSGTAVGGTNYLALSGAVTIASGATSAAITVQPVGAGGQGNKTVVVALSSNAAYTIGSPASATVTIADSSSGGGGVVLPDSLLQPINHLALVPSNTDLSAKYNDQDAGLVITSTTTGGSDAGGSKHVAAGLQAPPGYDIVGVRVSYLKTGASTAITRIRIAQLLNPPTGYVVKLDDVTTLSDAGPISKDSAAAQIDPRGGVPVLSIGVTFGATSDKIVIRGVALSLKKHVGP